MLYPEKCIHCGMCAEGCYAGAKVTAGAEMTLKEVMDEVLQDRAYYKKSGGGVTLTGGEVSVQSKFAVEILKACKTEGIHTAIETNLFAPWEIIESMIAWTDLVMFDIKLWDSKMHRELTGVGNEQILENAKKLSKTKIPLIVRTPVIPGVNDTEEEIWRIASFVSELKGVLYYELLKFNPLGENKYEALKMENNFRGIRPSSTEKTEALKHAAEIGNLKVRVG